MLTEENILLDGSRFEQASVFEHQGLTNLFLPFDDVKLDMGKLAIWRLNTREQFGSMWRSDYVDNRLGGPLEENAPAQKPDCPLIGQNGNIFNLMGIASRTLKEHGMEEQAREMRSRIMESGSYDKAETMSTSLLSMRRMRISRKGWTWTYKPFERKER